MGTGNTQLTLAQVNAAARMLIQQRAVKLTQSIFNTAVVPANQNVINIIPRNVGLILGFYVHVACEVTNTDAGNDIVLTDFGSANVLSNIQFTDLQNNTRINTTGLHLELINSFKSKRVFGSSLLDTAQDSPTNYGSNWKVNNVQHTTITKGGANKGTVDQWFYVPLSYSDQDFRGAVWAGVIGATLNLQVTLNVNCVAANGATDTTYQVYAGETCSTTAATVTVYQEYLDQLPAGAGGVILPPQDISTAYELKTTTLNAVTLGNDFPVQYPNFRDFLSTIAIYYDGGNRLADGNVNYWALQSANFTNIWKLEPAMLAIRWRNILGMIRPLVATTFPADRNQSALRPTAIWNWC